MIRGRFARRAVNGVLVVASVALTVAVLELGARVIEWTSPGIPHSVIEARLQGAPADEGLGYDVRALIAEGQNIAASPLTGAAMLVPNDVAMTHLNIRGRRRHTTGQPANPRARIWLFGGSTMFAREVPDGETVASHLQHRLNGEGRSLRVENMGLLALTTRNQLQLLTATNAITPGDTVVFYDGVNDVVQWLFNGQPEGDLFDDATRALMRRPWHERMLVRLHNSLLVGSAFVRLFLDPTRPIASARRHSPALIERLEADYQATLTAAAAAARARGARFVHFLQPNIFTVTRRTAAEDRIVANGWLAQPGLDGVFADGYAALRRVVARLSPAGIDSFDISDSFEFRRREIFYDFCHVNGAGNRLVADAIHARLAGLAPPLWP